MQPSAYAQTDVYDESFTQGASYPSGSPQYDNWTTFIANLPSADVTNIQVNGSNNPSGYSCTNPALAQTIANNLRNTTTATVSCDGNTWHTGTCGGSELSIGAFCNCGSLFALRPHRNDSQWGGTGGTACNGGPSQSLSVSVAYTILPSDFSDAPTVSTSYSTARHEIVAGVHLGSGVTAEAASLSNTDATGDTDDGVVIPSLIESGTNDIIATVSGSSGYLQGWVDWNGDGDFGDSGEQIAANLQDINSDGIIPITVTVPISATSTQTFARFRWSTTPNLDSTTTSTSGEVEDYALTISQLSTTSALVYSENFTQGASYAPGTTQYNNWTSFPAGLPTSGLSVLRAFGSNNTAGYTCSNPALVQTIADNLRNTTTATVTCDGNTWHTGSCGGRELSVGAFCNCGSLFAIRAHRNDSQWGGTGGTACNGGPSQSLTVSFDLPVTSLDYSDALTSGTNYDNAVHEIVAGVRLGAAIDGDSGPIGNSDATGDGTDDDGITIPALSQGATASFSAAVTGAGYLQGWIDWNGDGDFDDAGEQVANDRRDNGSLDDVTSGDGVIQFDVAVPTSTTTNLTFARFRWSTSSGVNNASPASSGEVEDYAVNIAVVVVPLTVTLTSVVYDAAAAGLFSVPENDVIYTVVVTNPGNVAIDTNTVFIASAVPSTVTFYNDDIDDAGPEVNPVTFSQIGANLTFAYGTDVRFSDSATQPADFTTCNFVPSVGYDANVKFICINPKGAMAADDPDPTFTMSFRAQIK